MAEERARHAPTVRDTLAVHEPRDVYVDTNGFSDLFRKATAEYAQMRDRLVASARSGRHRFVTSRWTIEELGGIAEHDWDKYERTLAFVFGLVRDGVLVESDELVERELVYGRPLRGAERFVTAETIAELRRVTSSPDDVKAAYAVSHKKAVRSEGHWRALRERAWRDLAPIADDNDPQRAVRDWWQDAAARIDDWSHDELVNRMRAAGFQETGAKMYPLYLVPTVRNLVAEILARIAWNAGLRRRIQVSDDADTHHYAAACYAQVFVSADNDLRQIIDLIPAAPVRPVSMSAFAGAPDWVAPSQ